MKPIGRPRCVEYCPVGQWCSDARAALPDVLANHDARIEKVTIALQELNVVEADLEPGEELTEQQTIIHSWQRELGDRQIDTLVASRRLAADCLHLANLATYLVLAGCERGPKLRRIPPIIGATVVARRCRAFLGPARARVEQQIRNQEEFEQACLAARAIDEPDPSPLDYGLYLWAKRPED